MTPPTRMTLFTATLHLLAAASAASSLIDPRNQSYFAPTNEYRCTSFPSSVDNPALTNLTATYYPAGAAVDLANGQASVNSTTLPAFCRLVVDIVTNPSTGKTAGAELWLPDEGEWNGRLFGFGNGGWGGGVPYGGVALDGMAQGYASYGTDTGHTASMWDGSFGGPNDDDAIIDFAWRALHLTTVHAKALTHQYYGRNYTKSYYSGCSTGGRQGIKAMTAFPEDYDGLILGAPANPFGQIMPWMAKQSQRIRPVNSSHWISAETWDLIHSEAIKQCDALDGVEDGIISDPENCRFRPELLTCRPDADPSKCITTPQLAALSKLYAPYLDCNQNYLSAGYAPGGEYAFPKGLVGDQLFPMPVDYYRYFVVNDTQWDESGLDEGVVRLGMSVNPGQMDTYGPDLTAFFARGGKVLQYAGWDDELISTGHSIKWYRDVYAHTIAYSSLDPADHFQLFTVPGMMHCFQGNGAWTFGGFSQRSFAPPLHSDARYDIQASMVDWVENGQKVNHLVGVKWKEDNVSLGVSFTRKLCPYPQQAVFIGGDESTEASFECR